MEPISLLRCNSYETQQVSNIIRQSLSNIGCDQGQFRDKRIGIKPNLLSPHPSDKAVITHIEFFKAVVSLVKENGGTPVLIESPGFVSLQEIFTKTEYGAFITAEKIEVADLSQICNLYNEKGVSFKSFEVAQDFFSLDYLINLPKFKTHGLTYITAGVKNLFGLIPGKRKAALHFKAKSSEHFANLLLDLYDAVCQTFANRRLIHILDAVVSMEGDGPGSSGTPRKTGIILAGFDAIALDFVAVNLMGLQAKQVLTITIGSKRGLGTASYNKIKLIGDDPESLSINPLKPASTSLRFGKGAIRVARFIFRFKELFANKPVPIKGKCTLCYKCKAICPAQAISTGCPSTGTPHFDYQKCFRCYCCMEACPDAAIAVKRGLF